LASSFQFLLLKLKLSNSFGEGLEAKSWQPEAAFTGLVAMQAGSARVWRIGNFRSDWATQGNSVRNWQFKRI
jgi:hypothetical protein